MAGKLRTRPKAKSWREGDRISRDVSAAKKVIDVSFDDPVDEPMEDVALATSKSFSRPAMVTSISDGSVSFTHSEGVSEVIPVSQCTADCGFWVATLCMMARDCKVHLEGLKWPGALEYDGESQKYSFKIDMSRNFPHKGLLEEDTLVVYGVLRS